jgi:glucose/arabinose dehydrogenase
MVRRRFVACSWLALAAGALALGGCGSDSAPQPGPPPGGNPPPGFTSAASTSIVSGFNGIAYVAMATDPNGDPLTFSIAGGPDAAQFDITPGGALSFRAIPNAGNPADQDRNNVYLVRIAVSDGTTSVPLDLSVTVTRAAAEFRVRRVSAAFSQPVFLAPVPGSDRVYVVERGGLIRILDPATGAIQAPAFLDVRDQISTDGERGLLGFATAPDFATSRTFYVFLTNGAGDIEIRRYRTTANPDVADGSTEDVILRVPHPGFNNHNGGWIGFGPDNLLYIGTGDGGGSGDPNDNAQNRNRLLGKILRIDPSGDDFPADQARDYRIPAANPFAGGGGAPEVLALGLRNPFRASFDGDRLYIGDVGQNAVEEIDVLLTSDGAVNFGWPILEGTRAFRGGSAAGLTPPVAEYSHGTGAFEGNSVTGGLVYRGPVVSLRGNYVFGDFVRPRIWSLPAASLTRGATQPSSSFTDRIASFAPNAGAFNNIASFGTDRAGNLYILDFDGEIFVLERTP